MIFRRLLFSLLLLLSSPVAWADDQSTAVRNEVLEQDVLQLKQANKALEQVIKNLIQRIEHLENSTQDQTDAILPRVQQTEKPIDSELKARLEKESAENYKLIQSAFEQRLSKEGGMLLGRYQFIYEPSLSYSHSSYDKILVDGFTIFPVLVVGDIVSERVRRDIVINNHYFRLGLGRDIQVDLVIPLGYEEENSFRGDGTQSSRKTSGLGDVSIGLSYQLIKSQQSWPDTVLALNWKTATGNDPYRLVTADELALGTGFNTLGLSLISMTNSDPIILFGGLSAAYTQSRIKAIGHLKPGASYGLNLGTALALNFDTSLSFNFQYRYTGKTEIDGQKISGSEITTSIFSIGLSRAKGELYAVDIDLGIGLTADTPDFQLTVSFPFEFSFL